MTRGHPPGLGQWLVVMDPVATGDADALARVGSLVSAIAEEPDARVPGGERFAARRRTEAEGLSIEPDLLDALEAS